MNASDSALVDLVGACPLAVDLSPQQVAVLAGLVELHAFRGQHVLAREGDADDRLIVVVDGTLDVVRHRGTPDETVLATLHAGDLAHELGFLDGKPRYASLVATSPARVLTLARPNLESLIDREPRILYAVMRAICRTVHRLQTQLSMQASELTNYVVKQHGRY
jgi:CRP/FNR family transcriptional regulator, cyclic AMP receptor protein